MLAGSNGLGMLTVVKSTALQSIQQLQERPDETLQLSTLTEKKTEKKYYTLRRAHHVQILSCRSSPSYLLSKQQVSL